MNDLIKYRKYTIMKIKKIYKENEILLNKKNINENNIIYKYKIYYNLKNNKICYNYNNKKYYSFIKCINIIKNEKLLNKEIIKDKKKFFNNNLLKLEIHIKNYHNYFKKYNYFKNRNDNFIIIKENYC